MKYIRLLFICLLLICAQQSFAQKWISPVPLVPNSNLKSLARANYSDSLRSYIIEYNPEKAIEAGPFVTAYFQAHEFGHIFRQHVNKKKLDRNGLEMLQMNKEMEIGADIYATEWIHSQDKSILLAMLHYLQTTDKEDLHHHPSKDRVVWLDRKIQHLSTNNEVNVACTHKLHPFDETACGHFSTTTGKPLHSYDSVPCVHMTHLEGDTVIER